MRESDTSFPDVGGQPVVPPTSGPAEAPPIETVPEVSSNAIVPESEGPLTNRQLLQRRMPSRSRIQAIIDRRRGLRDPWLARVSYLATANACKHQSEKDLCHESPIP
jgi:hypothetical protein